VSIPDLVAHLRTWLRSPTKNPHSFYGRFLDHALALSDEDLADFWPELRRRIESERTSEGRSRWAGTLRDGCAAAGWRLGWASLLLRLAIPVAAAVILAAVLAPSQSARGYIEAAYPLGRIIAEATNVVLLRVDKVDKVNNLIIYR
jgi:hypothetical protein